MTKRFREKGVNCYLYYTDMLQRLGLFRLFAPFELLGRIKLLHFSAFWPAVNPEN